MNFMSIERCIHMKSKHLVVIFCTIVFAFILTGCGHNTVTYMSGDASKFGVTLSEQGYPVFGYSKFSGEAVAAVVKENTLVNVTMNDTSSSGITKDGVQDQPQKIKSLLMYTGNQTTGYDVDLVKALSAGDPTAAKEAADKKNIPVINASIKDGKVVLDTSAL